MEFALTIDTDNAAFDDSINLEIARILHNVADTLNADADMKITRRTADPIPLFDLNGNRIGQVIWTHLPRTEGGQE